jgi:hypothetical protein
MEYHEETVTKLRTKLGREATPEEIKTERDRLWRLQLSSMMLTDLMLRDEDA